MSFRVSTGGVAIQGTLAPGSAARRSTLQRSTLQRSSQPGLESFQVNLQPKAGGWMLPKNIQAQMEETFNTDFSDVRIHVGPEVGAVGAIAFTWGSNIHFAPGQYNPHSPSGRQLLVHELTHVVQQRAGRVRNPFGAGVAVVQDAALESEADRMAQMDAMRRR